jgi:hypothetical protein
MANDLGKLVRHAQDMGSLAQIVRGALPREAAAGIAAVNLHDDGVLVVLAQTPAWAARLRFEAEAMLAAACKSGIAATSCRVRVNRG